MDSIAHLNKTHYQLSVLSLLSRLLNQGEPEGVGYDLRRAFSALSVEPSAESTNVLAKPGRSLSLSVLSLLSRLLNRAARSSATRHGRTSFSALSVEPSAESRIEAAARVDAAIFQCSLC